MIETNKKKDQRSHDRKSILVLFLDVNSLNSPINDRQGWVDYETGYKHLSLQEHLTGKDIPSLRVKGWRSGPFSGDGNLQLQRSGDTELSWKWGRLEHSRPTSCDSLPNCTLCYASQPPQSVLPAGHQLCSNMSMSETLQQSSHNLCHSHNVNPWGRRIEKPCTAQWWGVVRPGQEESYLGRETSERKCAMSICKRLVGGDPHPQTVGKAALVPEMQEAAKRLNVYL